MKCKNVLCIYRGGGYDGCFWEWNTFSFDSSGNFFNLFTSGIKGVDTVEQAIAVMDKVPAERGERDTVYIYDLDNENDIDEFQDKHAVSIVTGIVKTLNDGKHGNYPIELFFKCDECGEKVIDDGHMTDWHGCGGIMSTADTKLCNDCYQENCCPECGEYDTTCKNNGGICDSCNENTIEAA